jgi:hypothetical protein
MQRSYDEDAEEKHRHVCRFSVTIALSTWSLISVASGQQSANARVPMVPRFEPAACPAIPVKALIGTKNLIPGDGPVGL